MKTSYIQVRLPEKLKEYFDMICEEKHINRSALIRSWIEDFVEEEKPMVKIVEWLEHLENFPVQDEEYIAGQTEDGRFFFAWGSWGEEVPAQDVGDGECGIQYFDTAKEAMEEFRDTVEAIDIYPSTTGND